ncbi:PepSY domain-containing protein [Helicobacter sp. 11S02596-1]|uniref:PepSY domain-containing protein n=1 Tax=Helicobacter sp. 11S02596-1 TaxID=1476194 RepID=UPI000BA7752F|nr:PepSY domain-containing protein [Helicobacter sp. 11S02596-1]
MKIKKISHQFHIYVSIFLLPMALLFAITGIVYIFGLNQDFGAKKQKWVVEEVIPQEKQFDFLIDFLLKHHIKLPSDMNPRDYRGALLVGSAKYAITLEVKNNQTIIQSVQRGLLGNMIMLHKAKAKWYFDILSVAFGISLVLFYISGVVMTAFCKNKRKEMALCFLAGLALTIFLGYLSL